MEAMVSHITSLTSVYSTVYLGADKRKHQSSASLAFVWGDISVAQWCIVGYGTGTLWDIWNGSIGLHEKIMIFNPFQVNNGKNYNKIPGWYRSWQMVLQWILNLLNSFSVIYSIILFADLYHNWINWIMWSQLLVWPQLDQNVKHIKSFYRWI